LAVVYGFYYVIPTHFQGNPIMDPLSCTAAFVGLWLCVRAIRRRYDARFIVLAFLVSSFVVGALSPYYRPPLTRLMFLSPFMAILASIAIVQVESSIYERLPWKRIASNLFVVAFVLASVIWNLSAVYHNVYQSYYGYRDGTTSELLRIVQTLPEDTTIVFVERRDTEMGSVDTVLSEYGMGARITYFQPYREAALTRLREIQPPFIAAYHLADPAEIESVREVLSMRFPEIQWRISSPGKKWSIPYFLAP
jgi:hypothetical protein